MSDSEDAPLAGCLFVTGAVIIAFAIGAICGAAWGWLSFGALLMLLAFANWLSRL